MVSTDLIDRARSGVGHASGLVVITLAGDRVSAITRFESAVLSRFGLPRTLPVVP